jgi:hypothetical protein
MLSENLKLARMYLVLLALFTLARWLQGSFGVPYERGHHVFSIVTLTVMSCFYYGAFCRRWRGARLLQAVGFGFMLGVLSQVVIFTATILSYALDLHTYFNHPTALNVLTPIPFFPDALKVRLGGLLANSIFAGITGAFGWALGTLLPEK